MKRARDDDDGAAADGEDEQRWPWETSPDKFVDGSEAVRLRFVSSAKDAELIDLLPLWPVQFVHQIFDPEGEIECPPSERVRTQ
jgi:hypothetical protein